MPKDCFVVLLFCRFVESMDIKQKNNRRFARKKRVKKNISSLSPRLSVFRSNRFIYAQIHDDAKGNTLSNADDTKIKGQSKIDSAREAGKMIAEMALKKNIKQVVFDRAGYLYHGRVKALADGAREGGLEF